jgi:hypothetical protein
VKLDLNDEEEESEEEEEEEEEEEKSEEEEEDIIDLDFEANDAPEEEQKEEIKVPENLNLVTNTETVQNQATLGTTKNKTAKKTFFTPKNQTLLGKIFVNTTQAHTDENANFTKTEGNNVNKTAITMLAEKLAKEYFLRPKQGAQKINIYEYLLHDEYIQKFLAKNSGDHEKFNNFISRSKDFSAKKTMKLQERIDKINDEQDFTCHGNPNNKVIYEKDIRKPEDFLSDNMNYMAKKDIKIAELRTKIVEDTNKHLTHVPVISEATKKMAENKNGENPEVYSRLHKGSIKHNKPHAFNPDNIKRKPKYKKKELEGLDLTNLKKDIKDILTNVEKLNQDAKDRKKNKEKPAITLKDIYDIDNIASESSKYVFLDSFVKNFEQSVCDLFFVRDNYMLSFDDFISLLHKLGFIKFDLKKQKELLQKKVSQEEEKKSLEGKEHENSHQNNSNIQQSMIKSDKNSMKRGKSEKPEDRVFKKVDKEINVMTESWKYLSKKDQEKVNTNQVLVFLAGILGLYEGEKPEEVAVEKNNIKVEPKEVDPKEVDPKEVESKEETKEDQKEVEPKEVELKEGNVVEEEVKTNVEKEDNKESEMKVEVEKIDENNVVVVNEVKKDDNLLSPVVVMKPNKSEEHIENEKKGKKSKNFYNAMPFNCGNLHPSYKKSKKEAKSEEKPKKTEILLKKVVPEIDLTLYSFSAKMMNHLKFHFRYFYDNRMNFLLKEKRKYYNNKTITQTELVFKPKLGAKTLKSAEEYRKKCKELIKAEFNHQDNQEQGAKSGSLKLEEIYNILRLKKENEIAKLKLQQNEELIKKCTFQPNAHIISKSPKTNPIEVAKKLFVDADQRKNKKHNQEEEKKKKDEIPVDFPFQPVVNHVKTDVFQTNPIQNDEDVKKKVERYERARIEKKLCELQKKKGVNNFKNVSNIEEMIKKEEHTPMKFGIESKTYKDTFEVRKVQEKKDGNFKQSTVITKPNAKGKGTFMHTNNDTNNNVEQNDSNQFEHENNTHNEDHIENNTENYNSNENNTNSNQVNVESETNTGENNSNINTINPLLILAIDVNISEEKSEKLEIYKNEDLGSVLETFCTKHGLDEEKKSYLRTLIEEKLNENHA